MDRGVCQATAHGAAKSWTHLKHLLRRADSFEKTLMLGKMKGRRRRGWHRMRQLDGIANSMDMSLSKLWELVMDRGPWQATVQRVTKTRTQQQLNNSF